MANRLVSNVYIIDSHQIAIPLQFGNTFGTTATTSAGTMRVMGVVFMPSDTTGALSIALGDTKNIILKFLAYGSGTVIQSPQPVISNWDPMNWKQVFIPVITAATACLLLV